MHGLLRTIALVVVTALSSVAIVGQELPVINYEGSSTVANFLKDAESVYGKVKFKIVTETESAGGELAIVSGTTDIGGVAKVPSPQVLGKGVVSTLIGWDAIAIVVNKNNPVKNLSHEQLRGIFTNKITNWKELGGLDLQINPYIVDQESATRNVFRSRILGQEDYVNCETVAPDKEIISKVSLDSGGIGPISFSFMNDGNSEIEVLSVNGQKASLNNQSYPITRPLYILWWPGRKLISDFADWTQTKEAQNIITKRFIGKTQETVEKRGRLIVYSRADLVEEGGTYFYPHEPYEIYSKEGLFLQYINNRLESTDENPSVVSLEPNQYLIWTETAKNRGDTKILVTVDHNVTTKVSVNAENGPNFKAPIPNSNAENQLNLFGDFRFRLEQDWNSINQDSIYRTDRGRARYRMRFGFNYALNKHVMFGARIRSGETNNIQSPHVTLGAGPENFLISIDKAYAKIDMEKWWIWMGKNNLPFWKENELWWDDDITPEGMALGLNFDSFGTIKVRPTFGYFVLGNNEGVQSQNSFFKGGQLKVEFNFESANLNIASGYYVFSDIYNRNEPIGLHKLNYKFVNSILELQMKTKTPLAIGLEYLVNLENYNEDPIIRNVNLQNDKIGYIVSFKAGSLNETGNILFSYYYSYIPKYAVVDYLAQDDWVRWDLNRAIGTRSSNFRGHEIRLAYSFGKGFNVIARSYFVNSIKKEKTNQKALETGSRFRLDFNYKF